MSITYTTPAAREAQLRADRTRALIEAGWAVDEHRTPVVRRGARVLLDLGRPYTGMVEGQAYYRGRTWHLVRLSDGAVVHSEAGTGHAVAVDADTHLVADGMNNVNRLCNVRGDGAAGEVNRCWLVVSAVSGGRYLVKHLDTSELRVVSGRFDMTNLY